MVHKPGVHVEQHIRMVLHVCLFTAQCIAPLGMESGLIPDRDISASSCYNDGNVAPQNGRFVSLTTIIYQQLAGV